MIFNGRNLVKYPYSRYGYTRGGGKIWHGGIDVCGLDDDKIRMPGYNGKSIAGTVVTARIVTNKRNKTWEWGYYICVKLDATMTVCGGGRRIDIFAAAMQRRRKRPHHHRCLW